jgi:hypothetical protein
MGMGADWDFVRASEPVASGEVVITDGLVATSLIQEIRNRFTKGSNTVLWWEDLSVTSSSIPYSDSSEGLEKLATLVGNGFVNLAILDDDSSDRSIASGPAAQVIAVLTDCPFMEAVLFPTTLEWAVFDTHHNMLVVAGDPPGR